MQFKSERRKSHVRVPAASQATNVGVACNVPRCMATTNTPPAFHTASSTIASPCHRCILHPRPNPGPLPAAPAEFSARRCTSPTAACHMLAVQYNDTLRNTSVTPSATLPSALGAIWPRPSRILGGDADAGYNDGMVRQWCSRRCGRWEGFKVIAMQVYDPATTSTVHAPR